jgi:hypothetical protein
MGKRIFAVMANAGASSNRDRHDAGPHTHAGPIPRLSLRATQAHAGVTAGQKPPHPCQVPTRRNPSSALTLMTAVFPAAISQVTTSQSCGDLGNVIRPTQTHTLDAQTHAQRPFSPSS